MAAVPFDPWGLSVEPARFDAQMAFLRKRRSPMSVHELVCRMLERTLPADAVAITFDDGYRDNALVAKPILEKHHIPATFFIATGNVERRAPFWWDELGHMILPHPHSVQHEVSVGATTVMLAWNEPERADLAGSWRATNGPATARQRCYLTVWSALQRADGTERERVMESLRASFPMQPNPLALPMDVHEVRALAAADGASIGAHTVDHPLLSTLTASQRRREIVESAERCRTWSARPVEGFAYPYGDLDSVTRDEVRSAGFRWACSTRRAFVSDDDADLYALPRIGVEDISVRRFSALLRD